MKRYFKFGLRAKSTLALGGIIAIVLIIIIFVSNWQSKHLAETKVLELEQSNSIVLKRAIEVALENHRRTLLSLRDVPHVQSILSNAASNNENPLSVNALNEEIQSLTNISLAFLSNHSEYLQIRFIDASGDEIVRVHRDVNNEIITVSQNELQNKSDSPYVTEAIKLKLGQTFYSNVSLNREFGVIQLPHRPVIRIATPVNDPSGKVSGLVVINLSTERLFEGVISEEGALQRAIVDERGFFIKYFDTSKMFAFDLGGDFTLSTVEPLMAQTILTQDSFIRYDSKEEELEGFVKIFFSPHDEQRYWVMTFHIPATLVFSEITSSLQRIALFSLAIGLLSILFIVWFVSKKILTPVVTMAAVYERFKAGDLSVRLKTESVKDEILTLYHGINTFLESQQKATNILENEVAAQTKRLSAVIDNIVDGIITINEHGIIESLNPSAIKSFGYSEREAVGQNINILMPEPYHSAHDGYLNNYLTTGKKKIIEIGREVVGQRKGGSTFPMELEVREIVIDQVRHFVGIIRDITEIKKAGQEIQRLAFYDHLTDLPNRRLLQDRFKQALISSGRRGQLGAALFIDLDNFKNLNDTLGHEMGDMLLQLITQRLKACIRASDTVARLGGDEFVVLLLDLSRDALEAAAKVKAICENILSAVNQPCELDRHTYRVSASIGCAIFNGTEKPVEELMQQADIAMYQAKKAGRNTFRFFDKQMQENIKTRVSLETELQIALEMQQFELHYQIQVGDFNQTLGAEALIRWRHPERGLVPPMRFIPIAEKTGLIVAIGKWVIENACAQIKVWQDNTWSRDLVLSINVSAKQFHKTDFAAQVKALVAHYEINPKLLRLELTESLLQNNIKETISIMTDLSNIGVSFSLDDFGTGYSSLQYIKSLPLEELKIDKSFVRDITTDNSDKAIVSTIISMAHILGLQVIAEGVETQEQRQYLLDSGCTRFQGYLFGKPVPIEQFAELNLSKLHINIQPDHLKTLMPIT
jgi:diguanylate cyclase (GGDEF)-like protein/PAS domain S-box-containing protein